MADIEIIPAFLPVFSLHKRYKIFGGGRGGGKSVNLVDAFTEKSRCERLTILCTREIQKSIKESVYSLICERILKHGWESEFEILQTEIRNIKTGSRIIFTGLREHSVDSIKSYQNVNICFVEEAQSVSKRSWEVLLPTIRAEKDGVSSEIWAAFNRYEENDPIYDMFKFEFANAKIKKWKYNDKILQWREYIGDDTLCVEINFDGNPFFPEVLEKERLRCLTQKSEDYAHVWLGQPKTMNVNALWRKEWIDPFRCLNKPEVKIVRMVVAIDPSGGSSDKNDECGIILAGKSDKNEFYVYEDKSGHYTPEGWGRQAVGLYHLNASDKIIAEKNFGGDMVESTIKNIDKNAKVQLVNASRGKAVRAEPITALYEQGRVHHVGYFPELEKELLTWSPECDWSPNRLDALVWALTDLSTKTSAPEKKYHPIYGWV